jgi:signal transduction histidine kinase
MSRFPATLRNRFNLLSSSLFNRQMRRTVPLKFWLTIPWLLQILLVGGLTGWLTWLNGQQAVNRLAEELQDAIGDRVEQTVANQLAIPKLITQINADAVRSRRLNLNDLTDVEQQLFTQLLQFESVSGILIGTAEGELRAVNRRDGYRLFKSDATDPVIYNYGLDDLGQRTGKDSKMAKPKPVSALPWYEAAATANDAAWSNIFQTPDRRDLSLNLNRPIYNEKGTLVGVASAGIVLSKINDFLKGTHVSDTGAVFILERNGNLVATSTGKSPYTKAKNSSKLSQIAGLNHSDPLIHNTTQTLFKQYQKLSQIQGSPNFYFNANGQRNFVKVVPCGDGMRLDWLIVVVIPESDFTAEIDRNTKTTIALSGIAVLLSTLISIFLSNRMVQPMLRLSRASQAMAEGDLTQHVSGGAIAEMQVTADAFNHMAQQLQSSFTQIEAANVTLEAQVAERTAQLQQAIQELETLNTLKDDFLSTVSHELRSPMSNIKVATELLDITLKRLGFLSDDATSADEPISRYFQILKDECRRETELINDLLDLARLDAKTEPLMTQSIDFSSWIPHLLEPFHQRIEQQQQTLIVDIDPSLTDITTDLAYLERAITELVHNACKYTPSGQQITVSVLPVKPSLESLESLNNLFARSPSLRGHHQLQESNPLQESCVTELDILNYTDYASVHNRIEQPVPDVANDATHRSIMRVTGQTENTIENTFVAIAIINSGVEIPPEERDRIFEKFYRIRSNDPWKYGGTGLGLALVQRLVEQLQGNISVESVNNLTTFTILLPMRVETPQSSELLT